ncbi:predicted protein, partial [Nematostella vectensis]
LALFNSLTLLPTMFLNALILITLWRTPVLHTPQMALLANIALSDLIVSIVAQPITITLLVLDLNPSARPKAYCAISMAQLIATTLFGGVSHLGITALTVDRFLALNYHLRYPSIVSMRRVVSVAVIFWGAAVLTSILWIIF